MQRRKVSVSRRQTRRRVDALLFDSEILSDIDCNDISSDIDSIDYNEILSDIDSVDYNQISSDIESTSSEEKIFEVLTNNNLSTLELENNSISPNSENNFKEFFVKWSASHGISHRALNELLVFLKNIPLPKEIHIDARTILKTPSIYKDYEKHSNECLFTYFGIKGALTYYIDNGLQPTKINNEYFISLRFGFDGIPVCKGKLICQWPILCCPKDVNFDPYVIAICTVSNSGKPKSVEKYLKKFVNEAAELFENGFLYRNKQIKLDIKNCIICADAPARSFLKCTKGHASKCGCDFCHQEGVYTTHIIYETTIKNPRTDFTFRSKSDEDYHKGDSPLLKLPLDLIYSVPIDYMHCVLLGIMKKLLRNWLTLPVKKSFHFKLDLNSQIEISSKIQSCNRCLPSIFNRQVQDLNVYKFWKATELRTFLLYMGPICLKDSLKDDIYNHFMLLHVAIYIMCNCELIEDYLAYANYLVQCFVTESSKLYGSQFMSYNSHILLHLPKFVQRYGACDNFSCFIFENFLGSVKRLPRSGFKIHQQVVRRIKENMNFSNQIIRTPKLNRINIKKLASLTSQNAYRIVDFEENKTSYILIGYKLENRTSLYTYPCDSMKLGIFKADCSIHKEKVSVDKLSLSFAVCFQLIDHVYGVIPLVGNNISDTHVI